MKPVRNAERSLPGPWEHAAFSVTRKGVSAQSPPGRQLLVAASRFFEVRKDIRTGRPDRPRGIGAG